MTGIDRPSEPHELCVRPRQRRRREGAFAGREAWLAGRRMLVPYPLRDHVALVCRPGDRGQAVGGAPAGGELVLATLAGEDRPDAPDRRERAGHADVPWAAVGGLAIAVEVE